MEDTKPYMMLQPNENDIENAVMMSGQPAFPSHQMNMEEDASRYGDNDNVMNYSEGQGIDAKDIIDNSNSQGNDSVYKMINDESLGNDTGDTQRNNDSEKKWAFDIGNNEEPVLDNDDRTKTEQCSSPEDDFVQAFKPPDNEPVKVKPFRKRGHPRKIEDNDWEGVETGTEPPRAGTRPQRHERKLYVEDDDEDDDNEVEYVDTWFEGKKSPPLPRSTSSRRKSGAKTKRNTAGRKRERKSTKTKEKVVPVKIKEEVMDDFQCGHCDMVFSYEEELNNHKLVCGGAAKSVGVKIIPPKTVSKSTPACPVCHVKFAKLSGVKKHLSRKHSHLVHISCALCAKKIGDIHDNFQHFNEEHQIPLAPWKEESTPGTSHCPVCGNVFSKITYMKQHLVNTHSDLIHVTCALCHRQVGTMLEYLQHFVRYHSHSSLTRDKNKGVVTTSVEKASTNKPQNKSNEVTPLSEKTDLVCPQCNKSLENYKLLTLHVLSHKIDENTNIVTQKSIIRTLSMANSNSDQNSSSTNWTGSNKEIGSSNLSPKPKPSSEYPLPVWCLPPESLGDLSCVSSVLGPDLLASINCSLNIITDMATQIMAELNWKDQDCVASKVELVKKMNKLLLFSSSITDISKCVLLVLEESSQFRGNPYFNNFDIADEFDKEMVDDEDDDIGHDENGLPKSYPLLTDLIPRVEIEKQPDIDIGTGANNSVGQSGKSKSPRKAAALSSTSVDKTKPKRPRKKYICRQCGRHLAGPTSLQKHMLTHTEARPFKCTKCTAAFKAEDHLRRHILTHLKDDQFKCDFCEFTGRTVAIIQKHAYEEHPMLPFFSCDQCNHQFKTSHELAEHKKIHEPRKCKMCDFEAWNLSDLTAHEKQVHATKQCSVCPYRCFTDAQLKRHSKTHIKPENEKIFCCELCGATFDRKRNMEYHVKRHANKTPLSCNQCDYKCSSRTSYDAHMRKHSGLKPYKCQLCDASFYRQSYLKQHMRMHSDEKEFCCRYCGKSFKYRYSCLEHERIHTGEKKFKCKYCDFGCARRKILEQHMAEHKSRSMDVAGPSEEKDPVPAMDRPAKSPDITGRLATSFYPNPRFYYDELQTPDIVFPPYTY